MKKTKSKKLNGKQSKADDVDVLHEQIMTEREQYWDELFTDWEELWGVDEQAERPKGVQNKKQKQKDYYDNVYDKPKIVKFKTADKLNMEKHFYMPKLDQKFHPGSQNAVAVYPVLCGRADFRDATKWARISRENIGRLAGISAPSVDEGLSRLMKVEICIWKDTELMFSTPLLQRQEWQDGKRRGYEYIPGFFRYDVEGLDPKQWRTQYFIFHTCIVDSGVWAKLSRKAKALYWAMRSEAFFDQHAYQHIEGVYIPSLDEVYPDLRLVEEGYADPLIEDETERKKFRKRKWDVCDTSLKELFELARIPYADTRLLVDELEQAGLVERVLENKSVFKVFLRPEQL